MLLKQLVFSLNRIPSEDREVVGVKKRDLRVCECGGQCVCVCV